MPDHAPQDDQSPDPIPSTEEEARAKEAAFNFEAYPEDALFHDRRGSRDRRDRPVAVVDSKPVGPTAERRVKKERRRRIDPTTFEKQYTDDELEFMNAMQRFKVHTGKSFPSHGDVLRVAYSLGYRKLMSLDRFADPSDDEEMDGAIEAPGEYSSEELSRN